MAVRTIVGIHSKFQTGVQGRWEMLNCASCEFSLTDVGSAWRQIWMISARDTKTSHNATQMAAVPLYTSWLSSEAIHGRFSTVMAVAQQPTLLSLMIWKDEKSTYVLICLLSFQFFFYVFRYMMLFCNPKMFFYYYYSVHFFWHFIAFKFLYQFNLFQLWMCGICFHLMNK